MLHRLVFRNPKSGDWTFYRQPVDVIVATRMTDVVPALTEAARRVDADGLHAAGFVAYEAAPAFDASLTTREPGALPLVCFGLFDGGEVRADLPGCAATSVMPSWALDTDRSTYEQRIDDIRAEIAAGNTYQVNYTLRNRSPDAGDPWNLFCRVAGDAGYAAYIEADAFAIASASPELFFDLEGDRIVTRPMKGTARRGMTLAADRAIATALSRSAKNRAENVMITDMLRNDLGRIARPGTVAVESLCDLEKYATVWQLTSTVVARSTAGIADVFRALFPCASVTGAPKSSSMRFIAGFETSPRGVYTGAIGRLRPGRRATFSVGIRTAVVDRRDGSGTYGVGGGIVWDSSSDDEYRECLAKTRVLEAANPMPGEFELLETLLWTPASGFALLDRHLERLSDSADYFDFELDAGEVTAALAAAVDGRSTSARVRLRVRSDGRATVECGPVPRAPDACRLGMAAAPVDVRDPFLYHKTTWRRVYERALAARPDCDDVLLWNADGQLTESCIANLVVQLDGQRCTPPVACGLLAGTRRAAMLAEGSLVERVLTPDDLVRADAVSLINAVRGEFPVTLVDAFRERCSR